MPRRGEALIFVDTPKATRLSSRGHDFHREDAMSKLFAAILVGCTLAVAPLVALAGDANLDPTFGNFGVVTTNLQFNNDVAVGGALPNDRKRVGGGVAHDHPLASLWH